ncbi:hypothetical protein F5X71_34530 [Nocardia brasiliensis]|uniref:Uncharacterized protein n=1 Tax=Nocardia brasiliensis TaxID=37326 RepID=A0A6G9Y0Q0_NOCBR|nr:hypothetical protein [Nocardia brasiliensis]QIS06744.1 hypothetical protein F5X71_34530 [Nocardia brasiliensis]
MRADDVDAAVFVASMSYEIAQLHNDVRVAWRRGSESQRMVRLTARSARRTIFASVADEGANVMMSARQVRQSSATCIPLVAVAMVVLGCSSSPEDEARNLEMHRQRLLTGKCRELVEGELKSPGSAKFSGETVTGDAAAGWTAAGNVDSQNSFGALLRSAWSCSARLEADGDTIYVKLTRLAQL